MLVQKNKLKITEVFEISLRIDQWQKIGRLAKKHKITFSWVVTRLCLFKLLAQYNDIPRDIQLANASEKSELKKSKEKSESPHRHMLCLYGQDSIRIRFLAAYLGMTITQLVRVALFLFLEKLGNLHDKEALVLRGIKLIAVVMENRHSYTKVPFELKDYWPYRPPIENGILGRASNYQVLAE